MYQTKKTQTGNKKGKQKWPPVTLLLLLPLGDWRLKRSHPHRSAHTGTHDGGGLYSSLLGGCLVFIEAEPHFGVKIICVLILSLTINKTSLTHLHTVIQHVAFNYYFRSTCEFTFILFRGQRNTNHCLELMCGM